MAQKTDTKTLELIKEVDRQKKEIAKAEKAQFITNCSFSYLENGSANTVNFHVESNIGTLVKIATFLVSREKAYNSEAQALGIEDFPSFTWQGYSVADWVSDIKQRITKIQIASKKKQLEALEARLNIIISPELRAEMELAAIENDLQQSKSK